MAKIHVQKLKRKRLGKTNYRKRLKTLVSHKPRLVIRKSLRNIQLQLIGYDKKGDKVIVSSHSNALKKFGWPLNNDNLPAAYLTGLLIGKNALQKHIKEAVLDIGLYTSIKGSRLYAALKGVVDTGFKVNHSPDILPSQDRINGSHIAKYAQLLKKNPTQYQKQFSQYVKNKVNPEELPKIFDEVKNKILKEK